MKNISELKNILGDFFGWHNARLDCFTRMLLALFSVRSVNLSEVAVAFASKAQVSSRYRRLSRFFKDYELNYDIIAKWIFSLFFTGKKIYLTIDRTNWFWGKAKINILMVAVAYEGVAIPLLWTLLNKAGNASATEHKQALERFTTLFGKSCIEGVLADREFASGKLFNWLNDEQIPFYIRVKEGSIVHIKNKRLGTAEKLFKHLNPKEQGIYPMDVELFGQKLSLAGARSEAGSLMIVATNRRAQNAIAIYLRRWEIETLFSCLKEKGFRFEDTHLTKPKRIEKLMALLAMGFCWAHKVGEWRATRRPIIYKIHRTGVKGRRPQNSYFRYGLDFIREILLSPFPKAVEFRRCLRLLVPEEVIQEVSS
jgi:hypothetical protein